MISAILNPKGLRIRAEVEGIPPLKVNPMQPNEQQSAAQAKRLRKMQKRLKVKAA